MTLASFNLHHLRATKTKNLTVSNLIIFEPFIVQVPNMHWLRTNATELQYRKFMMSKKQQELSVDGTSQNEQ